MGMRLRIPQAICAAIALLAASAAPAAAMTEQERRVYLEKLQQVLPDAPAFRAWLEKSGELPPDFDVRDFDLSADGTEILFDRVEANSEIALIDRTG